MSRCALVAVTLELFDADGLVIRVLLLLLLNPSPLSPSFPLIHTLFHHVLIISLPFSRNSLLAKGLVQKLTIVNHNRVLVTLNPAVSNNIPSFDGTTPSSSSTSLASPSGTYYFTIGSPETFERQLQEAQTELGIPSSERIPVTYRSETAWSDWAISLGPTMLLIGFFVWSARKMGGGMGGGAGGGANPFNVGKSKAKMFK